MELRWETPPPAARGRTSTKWADIAAALLERPGEWAVVAESNSGANSAIRCLRRFGTFEATARSIGSGRFRVYARAVAW